jgi:uncharacterized damage-inducible protein DinB
MTSVGETLATKFEAANNEIIDRVGNLSDEQWARVGPEGWSVAVTAHHIAESYGGLTGLVQTVATGGPLPPLTPELLNQGNAEHAVRAAGATKAETIQLLRDSGQNAATMLRSLTDEQCARTATMPLAGNREMSAAQFAEGALIGHGNGHFAGIESVTA